uniref:C3H1-type domain-containing protein n=1 Tax=Heterosigma akashiwo TaxID=2829 RepID=A0A7S3XTG7_HETAK
MQVKKEGTEAGKDEGNEDQNKETQSKEGESKPLCKFFSATGKCKKGEICEFLHDASKPKIICRFFSDTGKCKKGSTCEYAHERPGPKAEGGARAAAAAPAPGGSDDRPVCKFFLDGRCRSGLDCRFRHVDLLTYKTRDCKFFRRGTCGDGDGCHYAHSVEERRTPSAAALAAAATMMCQGVLGKRPLPGGFEQGGGPLFQGGGVMMQGPSSFQYGYQNYGSGGVGSDGWQGGSFGRENNDVSFDGNKRARSSSTWGPCRNGKACRMHQQGICKFDHSSGKATNPCRYGRKCRLNRTGECTFQHF